jgi:hypothetical protein
MGVATPVTLPSMGKRVATFYLANRSFFLEIPEIFLPFISRFDVLPLEQR